MRTIISGSRGVSGEHARALVNKALNLCPWTKEITEIIHGDALGIDTAADEVCRGRWPVTPVPADWDLGKAAGMIRNKQMAEMADAVIAVWDGESPGTSGMIRIARDMRLRLFIYNYGEPKPKGGFGLL